MAPVLRSGAEGAQHQQRVEVRRADLAARRRLRERTIRDPARRRDERVPRVHLRRRRADPACRHTEWAGGAGNHLRAASPEVRAVWQSAVSANDTRDTKDTQASNPHRTTSSMEIISLSAVLAGHSSGARAGMFRNWSLPRNGRVWKSHSLPAAKPNSMSHGRGLRFGSSTGSKFAVISWPAPTISWTSLGLSTVSLPEAGT